MYGSRSNIASAQPPEATMHRDSRTRVLAHATLLAVLTSSIAAASHAQINGIPLCTASGNQYSPAITADGAGGVIIAWHDVRAGGSGVCYAQRVSAAGAPLWTADGVPLSTTGDPGPPAIASDGAGGAYVVYAGDGTVPRIQWVNAAGAPQWGANGVQLSTSTFVRDMSVIRDVGGAGGAIAVWRDDNGVAGIPDIGAQKVSGAGLTQWGASGLAVTSTNSNSESHPAMITDGAGGMIVIWFISPGVRAQRFNAAGTPQWGTVSLSGVSNNMQPSIASDGAGGAVVAWSGGGAIYAHRVSSTGVRVWSPMNGGVLLASSGNLTAIISDGAGGATVAWQDITGSNYNIFAQRLNSVGALQWGGSGVPVCFFQGDQLTPGIVSDGGTGAIISWADQRMLSTGFDIYAERIDATGASLWTANGMPVCKELNDQDAPVIASDDAGGAWVAWQDGRDGKLDIYVLRLEPNGSTLSVPGGEPSIAARAWPNPFSGEVAMSFALPAAAAVTMRVFDLTGRQIRDLGARPLPAGPHVVSWDGRAEDGSLSRVGVYLLRLTGPGIDLSRSVVRLQ
jgi:hypothetical protein